MYVYKSNNEINQIVILVDSNILLDIITNDKEWYPWSSNKLAHLAETDNLIINDIIYTEISIGFNKIEELNNILIGNFQLMTMPKEALFLAGKAFMQYKLQGGKKHFVLPDFFIGAHAAILNIPILTRDKGRYNTYFPTVNLIAP